MQERFINAIHSKNKIKVTFYSNEDAKNLIRLCAPMDLGPSRTAQNKSDRFHMWDYESDLQHHILGLLPEQIVSIEVQAENFEPRDFITWPTDWFVQRNWGPYS